jgi:hypothetical protein
MKKSILVCSALGILCQSSFAAAPSLGGSPLFAVANVPDVGSTMALLALGLTGLAVVARKRKQ